MSRLRITGGTARGRVVRIPVGPGVRPTTERVREALFSLVGQDLGGATFLDAFGGSGIVGLEAWSRGGRVEIVERDRRTAAAIRRRVAAVGAPIPVRVADARRVTGRWRIVFADPPYAADPATWLAPLATLAEEVLVAETAADAGLPERAAHLVLDRTRRYGAARLWVYRRITDGG